LDVEPADRIAGEKVAAGVGPAAERRAGVGGAAREITVSVGPDGDPAEAAPRRVEDRLERVQARAHVRDDALLAAPFRVRRGPPERGVLFFGWRLAMTPTPGMGFDEKSAPPPSPSPTDVPPPPMRAELEPGLRLTTMPTPGIGFELKTGPPSSPSPTVAAPAP